ncbi:MAG: hypothetical protein WBG71_02130 [Leeuwenhoekiella sp.]
MKSYRIRIQKTSIGFQLIGLSKERGMSKWENWQKVALLKIVAVNRNGKMK